MGTFNTKATLYGSSNLIPTIATRIQDHFQMEGFQVTSVMLTSGGCDISVTKGGMFKAVLGMKSALKISLLPQGNNILFEAGIGIFGQQVIPTAITMFLFWPVLITQIWGMVEQAKLDDKALEIAQTVVRESGNTYQQTSNTYTGTKRFCTKCGTQNVETAKYCCGCGKLL